MRQRFFKTCFFIVFKVFLQLTDTYSTSFGVHIQAMTTVSIAAWLAAV